MKQRRSDSHIFAQTHRMRGGFTFIEVLVYSSILVVVCLIAVGSFISVRSVFGQARLTHTLTQAAETSLERMVFDIERATQVDVPGSVFGSSPGSLTLVHGPDTRMFYMSGTQLRVRENGVDVGPLTPADVLVESMQFTHYQNTHTEGVRVSIRLHAENRFGSTTRTFTTTALLRNSYE